MLLRLIEDIKKALDNDAFFSALALALTLPDICGKAKYPDEISTKKRYINWHDEYVSKYEKDPDDKQMPYLSGEVVYSLRCCFLHAGIPNIEKRKITEECCKINHFTLLTERKKLNGIYSDSASKLEWISNDERIGEPNINYEVNIRRLCIILAACAKGYYKENPKLFKFGDYDIVDLDERNAILKNT